jgi:DNA polymerase
VILPERDIPDFQDLTDHLAAMLEREKRRGRDFLRLGAGARRALAALAAKDDPDRRGESGPKMSARVSAGATDPGPALKDLDERIRRCRSCSLGSKRLQAVPGEGPPRTPIMVVGEGPGEEEDRTGRPFVGPAGELLTKMLLAIDLPREQVFIGNVVKCRPPGNRNPVPEELQACLPFLKEQVQIIRPRLLVALGGVAARTLSGSERKISELRGKSFAFEGCPVIPTYHPAYLLRSPQFKREAWEDLKKIRRELERLKAE